MGYDQRNTVIRQTCGLRQESEAGDPEIRAWASHFRHHEVERHRHVRSGKADPAGSDLNEATVVLRVVAGNRPASTLALTQLGLFCYRLFKQNKVYGVQGN